LANVALGQTFAEAFGEFVVLETPAGGGEEGGGGLGNEAFEDEVGTQVGNEIAEEVDVCLYGVEVEVAGVGGVFFGHAGALDELELVELEGGDG